MIASTPQSGIALVEVLGSVSSLDTDNPVILSVI